MKFTIYNDNGEVLQVGDALEHDIDGLVSHLPAGQYVRKGDATLYDLVDPVTKELIVGGKPTQPSPEYDWDWATKSWVGNVDRAKARIFSTISGMRNDQMRAPIDFDGRSVDAHLQAQDNIKAKRLELGDIKAGFAEPYPELLMWRDANDQMKTFVDIEEMEAWLSGLTAAIAKRGTLAYAWSWAKKEELAALTDFESVVAFQLNN